MLKRDDMTELGELLYELRCAIHAAHSIAENYNYDHYYRSGIMFCLDEALARLDKAEGILKSDIPEQREVANG